MKITLLILWVMLVNGQSALFLDLPVNARTMSLNGSFSAQVKGVEAIETNPSRLFHDGQYDMSFSKRNHLSEFNLTQFSLAISGDQFAIGTRFKSLSSGSELVTTLLEPDGNGKTWSYDATVFTGALAYRYSEELQVGATINYMTEHMYTINSDFLSFDFGMSYQAFDQWTIAYSLNNKGEAFDYTSENNRYSGNQLPEKHVFSVGFQGYEIDNFLLDIGLSFSNNRSSENTWALGIENTYNDYFFINASYLSGHENYELSKLSFGAGVNIMVEESKIQISYGVNTSNNKSFGVQRYFSVKMTL